MKKIIPEKIIWAADRSQQPYDTDLKDLPEKILARFVLKTYILGALAWDYAETVCEIAAAMRNPHTKGLCRTVRALRREYDDTRKRFLDNYHTDEEHRLAELFESVQSTTFSRLCYGLRNEISRIAPGLDADNVSLVQAVQMAMAVISAVMMFDKDFSDWVATYGARKKYTCLPVEFGRLATVLPEFAGDCYDPNSDARRITSVVLYRELKSIELYGDDGKI